MTITISGDGALEAFRAGLTGQRGLDLLAAHGGRFLAQLPVGVGKSRWLDAITIAALGDGGYDLVVVLCPTRRLIRERGPLQAPPPGLKVVDLRPRPSERCGPDRDEQWKRYEARDLAALGRAEICGRCPLRRGCFWPTQYGEGLDRARIVYATQAHLARSPGFLAFLKDRVGAGRVLALFDESDFIAASAASIIASRDLDRFHDVLRTMPPVPREYRSDHRTLTALTSMLQEASIEDLQDDRWRFPRIRPGWAAAVQRFGVDRYGSDYRFLGNRLNHLALSPVESRRRNDAGDLEFASFPQLVDCIVFTGTTDRVLTQHRLGVDLASPFAEHRFIHPETRWYNLASPIGTRQYFGRHAPQVLDFIAGLIVLRNREGKRVLVVTKKCFIPLVTSGLAERFGEIAPELRVVAEGWTAEALTDHRAVPLIHYGLIGTNLFEGFDVALCATGFYVDESVVNQCLQDVIRQDLRIPIKIETCGVPRRRRAGVVDPDHRYYDIARLVQPALEFKEHGVVIQAVGRVRPFTRPREILTFQMGALPGVSYDAEFNTLGEARRHFQIPSRRERRREDLSARVAELRRAGYTQAEAASVLGVSVRTIRNHER